MALKVLSSSSPVHVLWRGWWRGLMGAAVFWPLPPCIRIPYIFLLEFVFVVVHVEDCGGVLQRRRWDAQKLLCPIVSCHHVLLQQLISGYFFFSVFFLSECTKRTKGKPNANPNLSLSLSLSLSLNAAPNPQKEKQMHTQNLVLPFLPSNLQTFSFHFIHNKQVKCPPSPPLSPLPQPDIQKRKSQNQSHTIIRPMRNTFPALLPSFRHSHKTKDTPLLPHHNNNKPNRSHSLFLSPQNSKTKIQLSSPSLHFGFKYFHRAQNLHAMASVCVCVFFFFFSHKPSPSFLPVFFF